ncbi:unnamed protein product, partial [Rotaria socialis]
MASFRKITLQNRQHSSSTKKCPSYIRVNQSAIRPKCQQETEIKNEHKDIYSKVENHLTG